MEEYSNSPPNHGPDKPEILRRGEKVNDNKQNIHTNIDSQMDVKPDLCLHALPCPLVGLIFFHKFLLHPRAYSEPSYGAGLALNPKWFRASISLFYEMCDCKTWPIY